MDYITTITKESKLPEFAGVTFTIRTISHGLRSKIRRQLAPALNAIREKAEQISLIVEQHALNQPPPPPESQMKIVMLGVDNEPQEPGQFTTDQKAAIGRIEDINNEIGVITASNVDPVYLDEAFISMSGLTIQGDAVTSKNLYAIGPEELCQEVIAAIKAAAGLTTEAKENLELPTTSGAVAGGQMSDMNAHDANSAVGTDSATAADTSQS